MDTHSGMETASLPEHLCLSERRINQGRDFCATLHCLLKVVLTVTSLAVQVLKPLLLALPTVPRKKEARSASPDQVPTQAWPTVMLQ